MGYEHYSALTINLADRIATVTLNRPEKLNAVDERMHEELARVFIDLNNDPDRFGRGGDYRCRPRFFVRRRYRLDADHDRRTCSL